MPPLNASVLFRTLLPALFALLPILSLAEEPKTEFGPYVSLSRDTNIVRDVKIAENGRIYLLLNPEHKEKEIILKNSSSFKSGYRKWFNGEYELVSPANQGKAPNEYTDWVETTANYIEYYMDDNLILHLAKKSAQPPPTKNAGASSSQ